MAQLLHVSQSARRRLHEVLPPAAGRAQGLRVTARLAGTGSPAYELGPAGGPAAGDAVIDLDTLVVYVDQDSAPLLAGAFIDHVQTSQATGFLFRPCDAQLAERVKAALEAVRPRLQDDGGDVELVEVAQGRAVLAFQGSCVGCAMANMTLTRLLEKHLRETVPELVAVTAQSGDPAAGSMSQRLAEQA